MYYEREHLMSVYLMGVKLLTCNRYTMPRIHTSCICSIYYSYALYFSLCCWSFFIPLIYDTSYTQRFYSPLSYYVSFQSPFIIFVVICLVFFLYRNYSILLTVYIRISITILSSLCNQCFIPQWAEVIRKRKSNSHFTAHV